MAAGVLASVGGLRSARVIKRPRFTRNATVYAKADGARWIVATNGNWEGAAMELSAKVVEDRDHLGEAVLDALGAYHRVVRETARPHDWPALRLSRERSQRKFDAGWDRIFVSGANDYNVTWLVSGPEIGDFGLHFEAAVAPTTDPARLAEAIQLVTDETRTFAGGA